MTRELEDLVTIHKYSCKLAIAIARAQQAEKRVVELEAWKAACQEVDCYRVSNARAEEAEAQLASKTAAFALATVHAKELEAQLASLRPSVAEIERDEAIARAEQAEAQLADAKAALTKYGDQGAFQALRDGAERAEQAEAEADSLRNTIDNMRAMNIKLTLEATGKVLAAQAQCDAMREAVRKIRATDNITAVWHIADAALNLNLSTAGRNAARELVSKQAEDEGLWFVPVTITEDYLQRALRALHEAVEGKSSSECARAALAPSPAGRSP